MRSRARSTSGWSSCGRGSTWTRKRSTLTVTTDETGPYAVPQIVFGVPLRLKRMTVNIDRPGFMFNPTNCRAQQITASGLRAPRTRSRNVASPFAVGGCKSLAFKPKFAVSTIGHDEQSRTVRASTRSCPTPRARSVARRTSRTVKVDLPKQLPVAADDAAEGVYGADVRSEPRGLSRGVDRGDREGDHAVVARWAVGPGVFRLSWRGSVPVADRRAAG